MDQELMVRGGAMVPMENGGFASVTWPLAVLSIEDGALFIRFSSRLVKRIASVLSAPFRSNLSEKNGTDWWTIKASEVDHVQLGHKSLIIKSANGDVRFVVMSNSQMPAISQALTRLGIQQEKTRTTVISQFGMSTNRRPK